MLVDFGPSAFLEDGVDELVEDDRDEMLGERIGLAVVILVAFAGRSVGDKRISSCRSSSSDLSLRFVGVRALSASICRRAALAARSETLENLKSSSGDPKVGDASRPLNFRFDAFGLLWGDGGGMLVMAELSLRRRGRVSIIHAGGESSDSSSESA